MNSSVTGQLSPYHLSRDYSKLYELICRGFRMAGWVDSFNRIDPDETPLRDICEIRREEEYQIMISARGTGYGNVWPFMKDEGEERDLFIKICESCNLEWIDPDPAENSYGA